MSKFQSNKIEKIKDNDLLLRRIIHAPPDFIIKPDGTPSSSNFSISKDEDGLSVDIKRLTTYEKAAIDYKVYKLYGLTASFTHSLNLENVHAPLRDNPAHALIKGTFTKGISRKLAKKAVFVTRW
ncbi:MAG: hypothetical protein EA412_01590 [Chitinophagaceae bacterium]|nr:MAG: hypothetical protein EA412_01590 [Chitinophagaceae bacterium]